MVTHVFNPGTGDGGSRVPGQPRLDSETLIKTKEINKDQRTIRYFSYMNTKPLGAEEMAQQVRALAALTEDPGSVPTTYMTAHNHL